MRSRLAFAFVAALSVTIAACAAGPERPYAVAPTSSSSSVGTGIDEIAKDLSGLRVTLDLAAMRKDDATKLLVQKAEESASPHVREAIKRIDQLDLRAADDPEKGGFVIGIWGRLPPSPKEIFGDSDPFERAPRTGDGADEWVSADGRMYLFVPSSEGAWVVAAGKPAQTVREYFQETKESLPPPTKQYVKIEATRTFLRAVPDLQGVSSFDAEMSTGAALLHAKVRFDDPTKAGDVEAKIRRAGTALLALLSMQSRGCKALEKISADVQRDGDAVNVTVKGLGEAAAAWVPEACPKIGGPTEPSLAGVEPGAMPTPTLDTSIRDDGGRAVVAGPGAKVCSLVGKVPQVQLSVPARRLSAPMDVVAAGRMVQMAESSVRPESEASLQFALVAYGELRNAIDVTCKTRPQTTASADVVAYVNGSAARVREHCESLKRIGGKLQCAGNGPARRPGKKPPGKR